MVSADIDDLGSLTKAFRDGLLSDCVFLCSDTGYVDRASRAAFCLTNPWEHLFSGVSAEAAGEKLAKQASSIALTALKMESPEYDLFSSLSSASELTKVERLVHRKFRVLASHIM